MNQLTSRSNIETAPEQLAPIIEAIIEGKYSWACVLILRSAGYNPLHYIPYRTYNRLVKENCPPSKLRSRPVTQINKRSQGANIPDAAAKPKNLSKIQDLSYLEAADETSHQVSGGSLVSSCTRNLYPYASLQDDLRPYQYLPTSIFRYQFARKL